MQVFWKTEQVPQYSEENSVKVPVRPSSGFVDYVIPLRDAPGWKGRVTELRLDPVETEGIKIEIEHIRLE